MLDTMTAIQKFELLTRDESYDNRRRLFKDIWKTAMSMKDNKEDIMTKHKVIKTLRLDQTDIANKKEKQRIKNLRHVCTKILDFCDKQDADGLCHKQMTSDKSPVAPDNETQENYAEESPSKKKKKGTRRKRKLNKAKSLYTPYSDTLPPKATVSERKEDSKRNTQQTKTSRNTSTNRITRTARVSVSAYKALRINSNTSPKKRYKTIHDGDNKGKPSRLRRHRKVVKNKSSNQKNIVISHNKSPGTKCQ